MEESADLSGEVERLKLQLKEQDKKNRHMRRLQCAQSQEQEDTIARLQREIARAPEGSLCSERVTPFSGIELSWSRCWWDDRQSGTPRPGQLCCPSTSRLPTLAIDSWRINMFTTSGGPAGWLCDLASNTYIIWAYPTSACYMCASPGM